ncbi:hypothetical protein L195_g005800 [Trifolium pratense]|uniref:Uncharacterized protein n=1 Tax=Trifolium pratense TaxID=57577 RepID=A0A2K3P1T9_TRIPR|nr:hypothetical protein L195_g005800 [Trifolium pratense]
MNGNQSKLCTITTVMAYNSSNNNSGRPQPETNTNVMLMLVFMTAQGKRVRDGVFVTVEGSLSWEVALGFLEDVLSMKEKL